MAIGLLLFRTRLITLEGSRSLANLLLYVVLPAAVLNSFCVERTPQRAQMLLVSILGSIGVLGIGMLLSHLMFRKNPLRPSAPFDISGMRTGPRPEPHYTG